MQAEQKRRFEEWKKLENPKYQPTDDSMQDRRDWTVWSAAVSTSPHEQQSERERFEEWDSVQYEIDAEVYRHKHGERYVDRAVQCRWECWQARAALSHPSPQGWQPIESAPRDGTDILVMYMHIDTQIVHNAFYASESEGWDAGEIGWWSYEHSEVSRIHLNDWMSPTHWMPLPPPPEQGSKG